MEEKKATEVKCKTCEESRQVQNTQKFVLILLSPTYPVLMPLVN